MNVPARLVHPEDEKQLCVLVAHSSISVHAEPLASIESAFAAVSVPRSVSDDAPLFRFMAEECDFSLEHADGSFMDHLHFCADCDECFQRRLELQKHCKLANAKPDKESGEKHNAHQLFRLKRLKGDKEAQRV